MSESMTVAVGLDVHAHSIRLAAVRADQLLEERTLAYDEEAVERLLRRWPGVRCCYEAGPTGYVVYWQLTALGVRCEVVAPTLVPVKPGDRVDVMAIAGGTKATTLADQPLATPMLLGKDVLVIGLRTEQGTPVDQAEHGLSAGTSKLASILLAIPQNDEESYSAAMASSTFVLTLSTD